uniref:Uncharacterized protein n=1 Tax=Oryza meridionalis TaxID=40149 RepID=A0A0E0EZW6_9ORYZ
MAGKKRKFASSDKQQKQRRRRLPLGADADADAVADAAKRRRSGASKKHQAEEEASIPSSLSAKILREALTQQQEESLADKRPAASATAAPSPSFSFPVPNKDGEEEEDDDVDEFDGLDAQSEYDGGVPEIDEENEKTLAAFMSKDTSSKRTLGDIILKKIRQKDAEITTEAARVDGPVRLPLMGLCGEGARVDGSWAWGKRKRPKWRGNPTTRGRGPHPLG